MFRHRYTSANITFKCNLKLTEVWWGGGNPFTGSTCMSRIYDTIESVSNNRTVFHCFLWKWQTWEKMYFWYDYVTCPSFFNKYSCTSCWWLVWKIPCTSLCTVLSSALERMESLSLLIRRVQISLTSLDSFFFFLFS